MKNTAQRIEIEVSTRPKIVHYRVVHYIKWDRIVATLMIIATLLVMIFGHVVAEEPDPEEQEKISAFYARLEADSRFHEYQQQQIKEAETRKEAEAKAEAEKQRQKEIYKKMQADENQPATTTTTGTYVPRME